MPDIVTPDMFPPVVPDQPTPEPLLNMVFDFPADVDPPEGYERTLHDTLSAVSNEVQGISNRRKVRQFAVAFAVEPSAETQAAITQAVSVFDWPGITLAAAKEAKNAALETWFAARSAHGITVGAVTLAGTGYDQTRYGVWLTTQMAAKDSGYVTNETPATILDAVGNPVTLPLGQMMGLLLQYGAKATAISIFAAEYRAQITAATTVEALDAITFDEEWYP